MKLACKYLALVSACLLLAVAANADSVSYITATPVPYTTTDWGVPTPESLEFPLFDPSIGTLYEVDLAPPRGSRQHSPLLTAHRLSSSGTANTEVKVTVTDPVSLLSVVPDVIAAQISPTTLTPVIRLSPPC